VRRWILASRLGSWLSFLGLCIPGGWRGLSGGGRRFINKGVIGGLALIGRCRLGSILGLIGGSGCDGVIGRFADRIGKTVYLLEYMVVVAVL
jgi:hypothetical protein